jgi:hypothetical protein
MSILSVMPCPDWYYEPADLDDEEEDVPPPDIAADPPTVSHGCVWFTTADPTDDE